MSVYLRPGGLRYSLAKEGRAHISEDVHRVGGRGRGRRGRPGCDVKMMARAPEKCLRKAAESLGQRVDPR